MKTYIWPDGTKVCECYDIDDDILTELNDGTEYWEKVDQFWESVKDKDANSLTESQRDWLERIEDDCTNY